MLRDLCCFLGIFVLSALLLEHRRTKEALAQEAAKLVLQKQILHDAEVQDTAIINAQVETEESSTQTDTVNESADTITEISDIEYKETMEAQLALLQQQIDKAAHYIQKETTATEHQKNSTLAKLKEVTSYSNHIKKQLTRKISQATKDDKIRTIHVKNNDRKLLAAVNKVEALLAELSMQMNGLTTQESVSFCASDGIAHNDVLLKTFLA